MRIWPVVVAATSVLSCGIDSAGLGASESLAPDTEVVADSAVVDSSRPDTSVEGDTFVADTLAEDTFVADTFVADTFVADTFVPDTAAPLPACDTTDPTLIACYRFESNGKDESINKNDLSVGGASWVPGVVGKALSMAPAAKATIADNATWAVTTAITIELWVRMRTLPATGRMGLIDDDGRFGLFVYPPGVVRAMSPAALDTPSALPLKTWTHVAFTYDGATMLLYVDGTAVSNLAVVGAFGTPSGNGIAVGSNSPSGDVLDGEIDSLRVYRVARTAKQICQSAGTC